jgi:hypothetical protein
MKKFILLIFVTFSVWANQPVEINSSNVNVFKSLIDDALYLITGDKNRSTAIITPQNGHVLPNPTPAPRNKEQVEEEKKLLKKMGIYIDDGKIAIDANKTRSFIENLVKSLEKGIDTGAKKAAKIAPKEEDLGIRVENEKVEIDLNKTKNFMMRWMKAIATFAKELNSTLAPLDK